LFEQFGHLESINVDWRNGKLAKKFVAKIKFDTQMAAKEAQEKYNDAELDNNKLSIRILGRR